MAETTVETLQIRVDLDSERAERGLDRLTSQIRGMSGFSSIFRSSFGSFTTHATRATTSARSLTSSLVGLYARVVALRTVFRGLGKVMTISSDLTEVQNVTRTVFGEFESEIDNAAKKALDAYGISELTYKQISSVYMAMGSTLGVSTEKMKDMSVTMTELSADMASFFNVDVESASKALQSIFTGQTRPLRQFGLDITQATLQQWALSQGMNVNIQKMTQAEKAMLRYKYVTSQLNYVVGDFKDTQDTWHNSLVRLKQSFIQLGTVVGGTLINTFKPFVNALNGMIKNVINFATTVSEALGHIFGWKIEVTEGYGGGIGSALGDMADSIEDSTDGLDGLSGDASDTADNLATAAENAKKLKATILGFDELNVLNSPDTSSSSGSGSNSGNGKGSGKGSGNSGLGDVAAYSSQLTRSKTIFQDIESEIDSLSQLGKYISDTLSNTLSGIDWNSIYEKARNFGRGLADFLNGLITPELFYNVGNTIGNSITTVLVGLNTFAYRFDWKNFGRALGSRVNGINNGFSGEELGRALANIINGGFDSLYEYATTVDWQGIGRNISDGIVSFFRKLDMKKYKASFRKYVIGIKDAILEFATIENFQSVGEAIGEALAGIPWDQILPAMLEVAWNGLVGIITGVFKGIFKSASEGDIKDLGNAIASIFFLIDPFGFRSIKWLARKIALALGMELQAKNATAAITSGVSIGISTALKAALQTTAVAGAIVAVGTAIGKGIGKMESYFETIRGGNGVFTDFGTAVNGLSGILEQSGKIAGDTRQKIFEFTESLEQENMSAEGAEYAIRGYVDRLAEANITQSEVRRALEELRQTGVLSNEMYSMLSTEIGRLGEESENLSLKIDLSKVSMEDMDEAVKFLSGQFERMPGSIGTLEAAFLRSRQSSDSTTDAYNAVMKALEGMGVNTEEAARYLSGVMPDAFKVTTDSAGDTSSGIGGVWESFKSLFSGFDLKGALKMLAMGLSFKTLSGVIENSASGIKNWYDDLSKGLEDGSTDVNTTLENVGSMFTGLASGLNGTGMDAGSSFINGIIAGMQSQRIPMPHLYVNSWSPHKSGNTTYHTPNYAISWYKNGGLFSKADIIGVGEAGKEAVLPLENARAMKQIADSITDRMGSDLLANAIIDGGTQLAMANGNDSAPYVMNITIRTQNDEVLARAVERGNLKRNQWMGR